MRATNCQGSKISPCELTLHLPCLFGEKLELSREKAELQLQRLVRSSCQNEFLNKVHAKLEMPTEALIGHLINRLSRIIGVLVNLL